jgi:hypothetical protein
VRSSALIICLLLSPPAWGGTPQVPERSGETARAVASTVALGDILVIKADDDVAVVRAASAPLDKVRVGDRLGNSGAVVKEISAGRVVLDESFTGKDGKPNRALIVIKEGERGGTRYLQRADEPGVVGTKPLILPAAPVAMPAPKKPPQM